MTSNYLTENEERDIPSQILYCMAQLFFGPQYVCFFVHLQVPLIPHSRGQLVELIVYTIPPE